MHSPMTEDFFLLKILINSFKQFFPSIRSSGSNTAKSSLLIYFFVFKMASPKPDGFFCITSFNIFIL